MSRKLKLMMAMMQTSSEPRSVDATTGKIQHFEGNIATSSGYFYTSTVSVNAGQTVSFTGYAGSALAAIFAYVNGSFVLGVRGAGSSVLKTYSFTATEDCEVGISAKLTVDSFNVGSEVITINYPE